MEDDEHGDADTSMRSAGATDISMVSVGSERSDITMTSPDNGPDQRFDMIRSPTHVAHSIPNEYVRTLRELPVQLDAILSHQQAAERSRSNELEVTRQVAYETQMSINRMEERAQTSVTNLEERMRADLDRRFQTLHERQTALCRLLDEREAARHEAQRERTQAQTATLAQINQMTSDNNSSRAKTEGLLIRSMGNELDIKEHLNSQDRVVGGLVAQVQNLNRQAEQANRQAEQANRQAEQANRQREVDWNLVFRDNRLRAFIVLLAITFLPRAAAAVLLIVIALLWYTLN
ncbi:hypothetical protein GGR53DRAFT_285438 [Hypoxylon sp. FL1150]|nr:hypothetical protein GGR53DRAFT_285438 [Hypoxylon sp. FL1150]